MRTRIDVRVPPHVEAEIAEEAARLERSKAWVLFYAWRLARKQIKAIPLPDIEEDKW